jgi:hypothetical protein
MKKAEKFYAEMPVTPLPRIRDFISPSMAKDEVIKRIFAQYGGVESCFLKMRNDVLNARAAGEHHAGLLASTYIQSASSVLFDFLIDEKKRTARTLATNRRTRRSTERVRIDDRNEKILREWRAYSSDSVREFWLWMQKSRYSQLRDKERTDCDLKFAQRLKPRGKFLKYDVFRTLITPKMRSQKRRSIIS